jgi:hypothetical protein
MTGLSCLAKLARKVTLHQQFSIGRRSTTGAGLVEPTSLDSNEAQRRAQKQAAALSVRKANRLPPSSVRDPGSTYVARLGHHLTSDKTLYYRISRFCPLRCRAASEKTQRIGLVYEKWGRSIDDCRSLTCYRRNWRDLLATIGISRGLTMAKCTGSAVIELIPRQPSLPDGKFQAGRRSASWRRWRHAVGCGLRKLRRPSFNSCSSGNLSDGRRRIRSAFGGDLLINQRAPRKRLN